MLTILANSRRPALIFAATIAGILKAPGRAGYEFIGHPFTALQIATLSAMFFWEHGADSIGGR